MGLFIKQDENRTQLQEKIAADLAERLNKRPIDSGTPPPPAFMDNQHKSSPLLWLWLLLGLFAVVAIGWFLFSGPQWR